MSKYINTGGTAFPNPEGCDTDGMTLRDWFAGQVAGAMWPRALRDAREKAAAHAEQCGEEVFFLLPYDDVAKMAYNMADALVKRGQA